VVGAPGFEPGTSSSRTTRATELRYAPTSTRGWSAAARRSFYSRHVSRPIELTSWVTPRTRRRYPTGGGPIGVMIGAMAISEPAAPRYGEEPCSDGGCASPVGARCEYVDRRGKECRSSWCPRHQHIVDNRVFCRRHAGIMVAILDQPEDERELPDLDNRAPSLVEHMARRLHGGVVQLLQAIGAEHPGASIAADGLHATMSGSPRGTILGAQMEAVRPHRAAGDAGGPGRREG
jgi:hypothetical protein